MIQRISTRENSDGHDVCPETRRFLLAAILFFFTKQLLSQDSQIRADQQHWNFAWSCLILRGISKQVEHFSNSFLSGGHKTTFLDNESHTLLN